MPTLRPVLSGPALVREIADARPADGSLDVWWLGQSGYLLKSPRLTVLLDPYLSEHLTAKYAGTRKEHIRITESPLRGAEVAGADYVFASHKHSDHLDPGTLPDLLAASPRAKLVLPASLADYAADALKLPAARFVPVDAGDVLDLPGGLRVHVLPSAHEGLDRDDRGRHLYLGFVLEIEGRRLYHSGDTVLFDGLTDALSRLGPLDVAWLPINGRDARRAALGVSGNMTFDEVLATCRAVRPATVVPHHYDLFTFNTADVGEFAAFMAAGLPEQSVTVLRCAGRWTVGGPAGR